MKQFLPLLLILITCSLNAQSPYNPMTNEKIQKLLYREAEEVKGISGNWQVVFRERNVYVITDTNVNRMRIISPIVEESSLKNKDLKILLEANFDRALDAKYSLYDGVLWSSFTHPLRELGVEQFKDAMTQVTRLVDTFGTTYTSTTLVFSTEN